jgi:hypothetical protein
MFERPGTDITNLFAVDDRFLRNIGVNQSTRPHSPEYCNRITAMRTLNLDLFVCSKIFKW